MLIFHGLHRRRPAIFSLATLIVFVLSFLLTVVPQHALAAGNQYVLSSDKTSMTVSGDAFSKTYRGAPLSLIKKSFDAWQNSSLYIWNGALQPGVSSDCGDSSQVYIYISVPNGSNQGTFNTGCGYIDPTADAASWQSINSRLTPDPLGSAPKPSTTVTLTTGTATTTPKTSGNENYSFTDKAGNSIKASGGIFNQYPGGSIILNFVSTADGQKTPGGLTAASGQTTLNYAISGAKTNYKACSSDFVISFTEAEAQAASSDSADYTMGHIVMSKTSGDCQGVNYKSFGSTPQQIQVNGTTSLVSQAGFTSQTGASCDTTDSQGNAEDCGDYVDCGDNSGLGWITCSVINWAQHGATVLDHFITDSLDIDVKKVFDVSSCGGDTKDCGAAGYYKAWSSFRIIATAIIIIAGLVMVVSQALGFEFLDAYTVRKVLPRLAIAVIGISLSWPLMKFVVGFFDTVGFDIRELIYAPFSGLQAHVVFNTGLVGVLGAAAGWAILGAASLTFILTGLLAMLVGFLVLVIRQILLIVIIVAAPLAIACYILPGTQKVWKIWSDNFLGLLMMFPIISAFIAIGHVFSALALSGNTITSTPGTATASQIIGIIAYFIPYFLLPLTFRLATGFIGNIAGFVNDRNRGAFDRLKKYRGNKSAENIHDMSAGSRFNNRGLNALTSRASTSRFGMGRRGRAAYNQKMDLAAAEFAKSPAGMALQHNDGALQALTYGSEAEARDNLRRDWGMNEQQINDSIAAAKASGGFGRNRQVWAAQQLSMTGTGYDNIGQVARTIARVSHGNQAQASSLAGNINASTKQASRWDLAPGYAVLNGLSQAEMNGGTYTDSGPNGRTYTTATGTLPPGSNDVGYMSARVRAARGADTVTALRGKPHEVEELTTSLGQHAQTQYLRAQDTSLSSADRQTATQEFLQTMGQIDQMNQSKSYASPENQQHVNNLLATTEHLRTQGLDTVLGRTYDPAGNRTDLVMTGVNARTGAPIYQRDASGAAIPTTAVTQQQINNREAYDRARAPLRNPNDPNNP